MDVKGFFRQFKGLAKSGKLGNKGFTLLELLVVVAILAAIAGTATIALKDTGTISFLLIQTSSQ